MECSAVARRARSETGIHRTPLQCTPHYEDWFAILEGATPFQLPAPSALNQPNVIDIGSVVDILKEIVGSLTIPRGDILPQTPDYRVDIRDVGATVDAVKGLAYPFRTIPECP